MGPGNMQGDQIWDLNSSEATPNNPSPISAVDHHIDYREKKTLNTTYDHKNRPSKIGEIKIRGSRQDVEIRYDDQIGNSLVKTNSCPTKDCRQLPIGHTQLQKDRLMVNFDTPKIRDASTNIKQGRPNNIQTNDIGFKSYRAKNDCEFYIGHVLARSNSTNTSLIPNDQRCSKLNSSYTYNSTDTLPSKTGANKLETKSYSICPTKTSNHPKVQCIENKLETLDANGTKSISDSLSKTSSLSSKDNSKSEITLPSKDQLFFDKKPQSSIDCKESNYIIGNCALISDCNKSSEIR